MEPSMVIFDADDTLWFTEQLYDQARTACRVAVEAAGYDGQAWEDLERKIDVANVARFGHTPVRFPTSCVEALEKLDPKTSLELVELVRTTAKTAFTLRAPLANKASEILQQLSQSKVDLVLLTKGDFDIQTRRIEESGLKSFFSKIFIVDHKGTEDFRKILESSKLSADRVWSIGNSLASDINPSLLLGMRAIWIPAHVWEYEKREDEVESGRVLKAKDLVEASQILCSLLGIIESKSL